MSGGKWVGGAEGVVGFAGRETADGGERDRDYAWWYGGARARGRWMGWGWGDELAGVERWSGGGGGGEDGVVLGGGGLGLGVHFLPFWGSVTGDVLGVRVNGGRGVRLER